MSQIFLSQALHLVVNMRADSGRLEELIAEDCWMSPLEMGLLDRAFPAISIKDYAECELVGNTQIGRRNSVHF